MKSEAIGVILGVLFCVVAFICYHSLMYNIARPELTATNIKFIHGDVLPIEYSPEVVDALNNHKPIVALESTIVTHGMPYPENVNTAKEVQQVIRDAGATPATIAIMDQKIYIGLTDKQLDQLGQAGRTANKTSRRDIPLVLAKPGAIGGTTVSATMILAERAGIRVFATGGIGGVHRGAAETMDISSDLTELGRTPVTVVCAGVKSILDIELTMEYLETQGVTVVGFQTDHVPAFFSPSSGIPIHARVESAEEVAQLIIYNRIMKLESGIVVAVPIPADSVPEVKAIQSHIDEAVRISKEQKIKGKDITPFLLEKVNELSNGTSLAANIHLVKNNARVAAEIAIEYSKQTQKIEDNKKK